MKFNFLPNTTFFAAIPIGKHAIAEIFDIEKNIHEYYNIPHKRITKANKYLNKMYKRLCKLARASEQKRFMKLADVLLMKSQVFQALGFHKKFKNWMGYKTGSAMKAIWWDVKEIKQSESTNVLFKRIWIPKGADPWGRPLGVPIIAWRIYTWMRLQILEIWLTETGQKAPWQHGGYSKRGTKTFWESIYNRNILNKAYIYEFDLKGFFNNVLHDSITAAMHALEYPDKIVQWVTETLGSKPKAKKYPKITQERPEFVKMAQLRATFGNKDWQTGWGETGYHNQASYLSNETVAIERDLHFDLLDDHKGVPQGLGTSPFLSVTTLCNALGTENPNLIMYMDDGVIFGDTKGEITRAIISFEKACKRIGVSINLEKSRYVKEDGEWSKDLKIVGMEYDHQLDWMRSSSRSGASKLLPKANASKTLELLTREPEMRPFLRHKDYGDDLLTQPTHISATKHGLMGKMMSDAWSKPGEDPKRMIQEGKFMRLVELETKRHSFYKDRQNRIWSKEYNVALESPMVLTTMSTTMIDELLTYAATKAKRGPNRPRRSTLN